MSKNLKYYFNIVVIMSCVLTGCGSEPNTSESLTTISSESISTIDVTTSTTNQSDTSFSETSYLEKDFPNLGGTGKESDPYLIESFEDLVYVSDLVFKGVQTKGVYFYQVNDIDTKERDRTPIGTYGIPFEGVYDGNGKTISNLFIQTSSSFQGIFGFVTGTVMNLATTGEINVHLDSAYAHSYCGGIAGAMNNSALIRNCQSSVEIYGDSYVGGIVGGQCYTDHLTYGKDVFSVIDGCTFNGHLTGDGTSALYENAKYFGGISGHSNGIIINCTNNGFIEVETDEKTEYVGGIVGYIYYANKIFKPDDELADQLVVENCINNGNVTGNHGVGGIAGTNFLRMSNCINNGNIYGGKSTAGIVGINGSSAASSLNVAVIKNCKNYGDIETNQPNYAGGIVGYNYNTVIDCENHGSVGGTQTSTRIGGIVAFNAKEVFNCKNYGLVQGYYSVGGCVGNNTEKAIVDGCENYGRVEAYENGYWTGGIVGYCNGCVSNSKNFGEIYASSKVGGIVGQAELKTTEVGVEDCENSGNIHCVMNNSTEGYPDAYIGGLIGFVNVSGFVKNCKNVSSKDGGKIFFADGLQKTGVLFGFINTQRTVSENNVEVNA